MWWQFFINNVYSWWFHDVMIIFLFVYISCFDNLWNHIIKFVMRIFVHIVGCVIFMLHFTIKNFVLINCFVKYIFCYSMWCDLNWIQICVKRTKTFNFHIWWYEKTNTKGFGVDSCFRIVVIQMDKLWNFKLSPVNQF
jgi:hypothetical protein